MNEAKFTKGLTIEESSSVDRDYDIIGPDGLKIGEAWSALGGDCVRPGKENATLWAAAPEMYKAMEWALHVAEGDYGYEASWDHLMERFLPLLAKARGEQ